MGREVRVERVDQEELKSKYKFQNTLKEIFKELIKVFF